MICYGVFVLSHKHISLHDFPNSFTVHLSNNLINVRLFYIHKFQFFFEFNNRRCLNKKWAAESDKLLITFLFWAGYKCKSKILAQPIFQLVDKLTQCHMTSPTFSVCVTKRFQELKSSTKLFEALPGWFKVKWQCGSPQNNNNNNSATCYGSCTARNVMLEWLEWTSFTLCRHDVKGSLSYTALVRCGRLH